MVADLQQLRDMGCNFVRGSHYPQDVRFLDLCDEMGMCVWDESIGWQHKIPAPDRRAIPAGPGDQHRRDDRRRLQPPQRHHVGHAQRIAERQARVPPRLRALLIGTSARSTRTRPVTYAAIMPARSTCAWTWSTSSRSTRTPAGITDTIDGHPGASGQAAWPRRQDGPGQQAVHHLRDRRRRPSTAAATGTQDRWTEQYQARLLDAVIRHLFVDRNRACGLAIWQFCDGRTMPTIPPADDDPRPRLQQQGRGGRVPPAQDWPTMW